MSGGAPGGLGIGGLLAATLRLAGDGFGRMFPAALGVSLVSALAAEGLAPADPVPTLGPGLLWAALADLLLGTLLTGFLVLIGAAAAGTSARAHEAAVLKTLGASRARIGLSFLARAALMGLAAGTVALAAGIAAGWAVSHYLFETGFAVIWPSGLAIVLGGIAATLLASVGFSLRALRVRPARILRSQD